VSGGIRSGLHVGGGTAPLVKGTPRGRPAHVLRPMVEADLGEIVEIERTWSPNPWSPTTFRNEMNVPFSRCVVAGPAPTGEVVWAYFVRWLVADEARLLALAVRRELRGRGLAKVMLDEVLAEACGRGAKKVILEVEAGNEPARGLYASRGFVETGRRPDYYGRGRDAICMDLPLACRDAS